MTDSPVLDTYPRPNGGQNHLNPLYNQAQTPGKAVYSIPNLHHGNTFQPLPHWLIVRVQPFFAVSLLCGTCTLVLTLSVIDTVTRLVKEPPDCFPDNSTR